MPKGVYVRHHKQEKCQHCQDLIAVGQLAAHEGRCKTLTTEQRAEYRKRRLYQRGRLLAAAKTPVILNGNGHHKPTANGKRVSVKLSVDLKTVMQVLGQLFPHVSIDKVGVE